MGKLIALFFAGLLALAPPAHAEDPARDMVVVIFACTDADAAEAVYVGWQANEAVRDAATTDGVLSGACKFFQFPVQFYLEAVLGQSLDYEGDIIQFIQMSDANGVDLFGVYWLAPEPEA